MQTFVTNIDEHRCVEWAEKVLSLTASQKEKITDEVLQAMLSPAEYKSLALNPEYDEIFPEIVHEFRLNRFNTLTADIRSRVNTVFGEYDDLQEQLQSPSFSSLFVGILPDVGKVGSAIASVTKDPKKLENWLSGSAAAASAFNRFTTFRDEREDKNLSSRTILALLLLERNKPLRDKVLDNKTLKKLFDRKGIQFNRTIQDIVAEMPDVLKIHYNQLQQRIEAIRAVPDNPNNPNDQAIRECANDAIKKVVSEKLFFENHPELIKAVLNFVDVLINAATHNLEGETKRRTRAGLKIVVVSAGLALCVSTGLCLPITAATLGFAALTSVMQEYLSAGSSSSAAHIPSIHLQELLALVKVQNAEIAKLSSQLRYVTSLIENLSEQLLLTQEHIVLQLDQIKSQFNAFYSDYLDESYRSKIYDFQRIGSDWMSAVSLGLRPENAYFLAEKGNQFFNFASALATLPSFSGHVDVPARQVPPSILLARVEERKGELDRIFGCLTAIQNHCETTQHSMIKHNPLIWRAGTSAFLYAVHQEHRLGILTGQLRELRFQQLNELYHIGSSLNLFIKQMANKSAVEENFRQYQEKMKSFLDVALSQFTAKPHRDISTIERTLRHVGLIPHPEVFFNRTDFTSLMPGEKHFITELRQGISTLDAEHDPIRIDHSYVVDGKIHRTNLLGCFTDVNKSLYIQIHHEPLANIDSTLPNIPLDYPFTTSRVTGKFVVSCTLIIYSESQPILKIPGQKFCYRLNDTAAPLQFYRWNYVHLNPAHQFDFSWALLEFIKQHIDTKNTEHFERAKANLLMSPEIKKPYELLALQGILLNAGLVLNREFNNPNCTFLMDIGLIDPMEDIHDLLSIIVENQGDKPSRDARISTYLENKLGRFVRQSEEINIKQNFSLVKVVMDEILKITDVIDCPLPVTDYLPPSVYRKKSTLAQKQNLIFCLAELMRLRHQTVNSPAMNSLYSQTTQIFSMQALAFLLDHPSYWGQALKHSWMVGTFVGGHIAYKAIVRYADNYLLEAQLKMHLQYANDILNTDDSQEHDFFVLVLSVAAIELADFEKAKKFLKKLSIQTPSYYILRASSQEQRGYWGKALENCDKALRIDEQNPLARFQRLRLLLKSQPQNFDEIIRAYQTFPFADCNQSLEAAAHLLVVIAKIKVAFYHRSNLSFRPLFQEAMVHLNVCFELECEFPAAIALKHKLENFLQRNEFIIFSNRRTASDRFFLEGTREASRILYSILFYNFIERTYTSLLMGVGVVQIFPIVSMIYLIPGYYLSSDVAKDWLAIREEDIFIQRNFLSNFASTFVNLFGGTILSSLLFPAKSPLISWPLFFTGLMGIAGLTDLAFNRLERYLLETTNFNREEREILNSPTLSLHRLALLSTLENTNTTVVQDNAYDFNTKQSAANNPRSFWQTHQRTLIRTGVAVSGVTLSLLTLAMTKPGRDVIGALFKGINHIASSTVQTGFKTGNQVGRLLGR